MNLRKSFKILLACLMFAVAGTTVECFIACQAIAGPTAEPLLRRLAESESANSTSADSGWRLIRIRNPRGGPDTVSIMHSPDISRSDIGLAGLVLRCTTAPDVDTLLIVVEPLPPGSHPQVTFHVGSRIATFQAAILEPLTALLLPRGATAFLTQSALSQTDPSVSINIEAAGNVTKGVVPIAGLGPAFDDLLKSCLVP